MSSRAFFAYYLIWMIAAMFSVWVMVYLVPMEKKITVDVPPPNPHALVCDPVRTVDTSNHRTVDYARCVSSELLCIITSPGGVAQAISCISRNQPAE